MDVDVRPAVHIRRPPGEVAAFMFDPRNDLRWTGGITSSRPARPGPLVRGATVERTARFLGRTFTYGYVVTRHEPERLVELKVDRPFPMLVTYELEPAAEGTLVAIRAAGTPGGFLLVGDTDHVPPGAQEHRGRPGAAARLPGGVIASRP